MTTFKRAALVAGSVGVALVLSACGGGDSGGESTATGGGSGPVAGAVLIDGSSTVAPLSEIAAEAFMAENPDVRVTVGAAGTGGGFEKFCRGETDGNDASRPIEADEQAACEAAGIGYKSITVANDAVVLAVNPSNPVTCITVEQAKQLWDAGSTVKTWGEVSGLNEPADFAGEAVALYGPGTDSGTFDFFTAAINGEEGKIRKDYTSIGEDDNAAVTAVAGEKGAMAFIPYSFAQEAGETIKALEVDGGSGCVAPTLENVQAGTYTPLGRELYVYGSDKSLAKPEVLAFFEFYVNNASSIAEAGGFIGLTEAQTQEQLAKVAELAGK